MPDRAEGLTGLCLGDTWEHIKPLGRGSFGTVHLYRHVPSQAKYAVKFVERNELTDNVIMKVRVLHHLPCAVNPGKSRKRRKRCSLRLGTPGGGYACVACFQPTIACPM
jgi:serine/threonine protein kinase